MTWQSVGLQYTQLFTEMLNERWVNHRAAMDTHGDPRPERHGRARAKSGRRRAGAGFSPAAYETCAEDAL